MRLFRPACLFLCSLLIPASIAPQTPPPRHAQAVAVMQASFLVHGGGSLVFPRGPQIGLVAEGTLTRFSPGPITSFPFRVKALDFDRVRWEWDTPQGMVVVVFSGGDGWTQNARGRAKLPLGRTAGRSLEYLPILALAHGINDPSVRAEYIGIEPLDGRNAHRLLIARTTSARVPAAFRNQFEQMHRCELFVDVQTNSLQRLRYYEHPGDSRVNLPMDLVFSNYQLVQGVQIPFTVTRFLRGQRIDEVQIRSISFNAAIADLEFMER